MDRIKILFDSQEELLSGKNKVAQDNGIIKRFKHPIITTDHVPLFWKYDLNPESNPLMLERQGINATFNAGAMLFEDKYTLVVRLEGNDRKSFFAVAQSENGIDNFRFWDHPVNLPQTTEPDTNVYDMRLTYHEDGWIYGLFCTERRPKDAPGFDQSIAEAKCGIARTKNLIDWQRLPDLDSGKDQQRNVVLHPEFVEGKYALYTRPQDGFIDAGTGGGIGWALIDRMENPIVRDQKVIDPKVYHTIKEVKNGQGPPPLRTNEGWLHLAHGVRNTAAGLRYVLYMFMTSLEDPSEVIFSPGGHLMAPQGEERVGDVSNVLFSNGWIEKEGVVYIYYASSDTRMHVATSTLERLIDYCKNTPADGLNSYASVKSRNNLINKNLDFMKNAKLRK
ncbi:glycoside hydrolase family 130 protein [Marinigracilibium pacificum]|uniref:4-O-beta-D-mannosyl-D-glucose phosphorylase n=1 Tax=Marinigracilibium pacificum TaxID=2729599 RepID=A0A848J0C2_9BACT|nr:glycosidase [Marinigracilibium pacificum]NMM49286.1 glycosidase [Marinigracilibium pacificum]